MKIKPIDLNDQERQGLFACNIVFCMEKINELVALTNDLCEEIQILKAKIRTLEGA